MGLGSALGFVVWGSRGQRTRGHTAGCAVPAAPTSLMVPGPPAAHLLSSHRLLPALHPFLRAAGLGPKGS